MKKCKSCQSEIDNQAKKCPHCQTDQRNWFSKHKIITGILIILLLIAINPNKGSKQKPSSELLKSDISSTESSKSQTSLLGQNNPDTQHLSMMTADYVGKNFTLYVNAKACNYYNYGFRNETQYYCLSLWDNSGNEYKNVYGYINKNEPKSKELMDKILDKSTVLKIEASIPTNKYTEGSNSFLEISSWEEVQ